MGSFSPITAIAETGLKSFEREERESVLSRIGISGEAVVGNGFEFPDSERRQIVQVRLVKCDTQFGFRGDVVASGESDGVVDDAFDNRGVEEESDLVRAACGGGDADRFITQEQFVAVIGRVERNLEPGSVTRDERQLELFGGNDDFTFCRNSG